VTAVRGAGRIGAIGYLAVCAALAVCAWAPMAAGWRATVVAGDSMRPGLRAGDVVVYQRPGTAAPEPGRVLVVRDPARPGGLLTHRLVGVGPDGLRTKGDANAVADSIPVPPADVVGVGRIVVPYLGLPALWRDGDGVRPAVWVGSLLLAAGFARRPGRPGRSRRIGRRMAVA
jgi:signal peptidase